MIGSAVLTSNIERSNQTAVGSLMYLVLVTSPDIAYAVSVVSRYASSPDNSQMTAFKRIFRFLKATKHLKLM